MGYRHPPPSQDLIALPYGIVVHKPSPKLSHKSECGIDLNGRGYTVMTIEQASCMLWRMCLSCERVILCRRRNHISTRSSNEKATSVFARLINFIRRRL